MPGFEERKWPRNGFEPLFDYISNFVHLNINLGGPKSCQTYHDNWMRRYTVAMAKWSTYDIAVWSVRCRQSLKLSFTATFFALGADEVGRQKIRVAEYYMAYYSMLHAMWAVVYLHPDQSTEHVTAMTHSKIANLFHSEFASGRSPIIVENVKELAADLRFLREYYSYRMPLNSPFEASPNLSVSYSRLGGFVGLNLLDNPDMQALAEFVSMGCDLLPLSIGYDHMFDDFMTWDRDRPDEKILQRVRSLVGNALF
jgi:hypothetical protein